MTSPATLRSQVGSMRRVRALAARGWTPAGIEQAAGVPATDVRRALENETRLQPGTAARIAAAYDALWNKQPPQPTGPDKEEQDQLLRRAQYRAWPPPMAWDDDQLDNPDAPKPEGWKRTGGQSQVHAADRIEDITFLREYGGYQGASTAELAWRLSTTRSALEHAMKAYQASGQQEIEQEREAG
jgi:hypothetical protein